MRNVINLNKGLGIYSAECRTARGDAIRLGNM